MVLFLKKGNKMKEFKVGDKVFDLRFGNGVVTSTKDWDCDDCVTVKFQSVEWFKTYSMKGKAFSDYKFPTLYHGHDLIVEVKEPEYEWQVLSKYNGIYYISNGFNTSIEQFKEQRNSYNLEYYELFEPSKRLVKKG